MFVCNTSITRANETRKSLAQSQNTLPPFQISFNVEREEKVSSRDFFRTRVLARGGWREGESEGTDSGVTYAL